MTFLEIKDEIYKLRHNVCRADMPAEQKRQRDAAVMKLMETALKIPGLSGEEICFCLWNISDSCAMLRMSDELYTNHMRFEKQVEQMDNKYMWWTVCDTTQRFTLILGGHGEYWDMLYRRACENSAITDENYRAAFEAHRAAASVNSSLDISAKITDYAFEMWKNFLGNIEDKPEYDFYNLMYLAAHQRRYGRNNSLETLCEQLYPDLSEDSTSSGGVCGEWSFINRKRSQSNMFNVGICAAVNALIWSDNKETAERIYRKARGAGLSANSYIEKRLYLNGN